MPTALPARNIFDGTSNPVTSVMKAAMGSQRDYLAGLLGTTGVPADALAALSPTLAGIAAGVVLTSFKNEIINGNFGINQRVYVSAAAVGTNLYGHDRWKMAASADTYTFATALNVTTVTIPASKVLRQVIEGVNLQSGTYTLSWAGTAQGKIGAGAYGASGITGTAVGGTNLTIEFGPGTVSKVQFESGSIATPFEDRPYGLELSLCQRYYQSLGAIGARQYCVSNAPQLSITISPMRAIPTMTGAYVGNGSSPSIGGSFVNVFTMSSATVGTTEYLGFSNITASAEL